MSMSLDNEEDAPQASQQHDAPEAATPSPLVLEITSQLEQGRGQHAAKLLIDAIAQGSWPPDLPLNEWLKSGIDEQARAKLISGFSHYPCFVCANGMEPCDPCGGSGFTAVAQVCPACIGLGSKRCDFCNGAGLATYNIVPLELRATVLVARAARGAKYLQKLLQKRPPAITEPTAARYLQDINKLLGVLENAISAADQLADCGMLAPHAAAQVSAACEKPAAAADIRIRETLQRLSRFHAGRAASLPDIDAENARTKADFYSTLAQSPTLEGTGIAHPFLNPLRDGNSTPAPPPEVADDPAEDPQATRSQAAADQSGDSI